MHLKVWTDPSNIYIYTCRTEDSVWSIHRPRGGAPDRSLCWRALYVTHIDPNYSTRKLIGHATAHTTTNQELVFRRPGECIFTLASLCGTCNICQFWIAKWLVDEQLSTWTTRYVLRTGSRDASSAMKRSTGAEITFKKKRIFFELHL